jgi:thiamine biosynthesis lipoprotein
MQASNCVQRCQPLLGTYVEVTLIADASDQDLIEQSQRAYKAIAHVQQVMSVHDVGSELSVLNRNALNQAVTVSRELASVLSTVDELHRLSRGMFDPSVYATKHLKLPCDGRWPDVELGDGTVRFHKPLKIDLGGIAKGYAVDRAIEAVDSSIDCTINAGGDLRMTHWLGKTACINHGGYLNEVAMTSAAVATSGAYYDGVDTVFDPASNEAADNRRSVSVFAGDCMTADALTKLVWLDASCQGILERYGATALVNRLA